MNWRRVLERVRSPGADISQNMQIEVSPPANPPSATKAAKTPSSTTKGQVPKADELPREDFITFVKFVHHCTFPSKDKVVEELRTTHTTVTSSRAQAARKLDAIAEKKRNPNGGVYWEVHRQVLEELGLHELMVSIRLCCTLRWCDKELMLLAALLLLSRARKSKFRLRLVRRKPRTPQQVPRGVRRRPQASMVISRENVGRRVWRTKSDHCRTTYLDPSSSCPYFSRGPRKRKRRRNECTCEMNGMRQLLEASMHCLAAVVGSTNYDTSRRLARLQCVKAKTESTRPGTSTTVPVWCY